MFFLARPAQGSEMPKSLKNLWRYLAYVQTLEAWQRVDYGAAKIVEGWSKHH